VIFARAVWNATFIRQGLRIRRRVRMRGSIPICRSKPTGNDRFFFNRIDRQTTAAKSAVVKVFGCRPFTDTYRRAETGPAFENLQGRKPRVGRAPIRCPELWGFERRRRPLTSGRNDRQRRFGRIERSQAVLCQPRDDFFWLRPCSGEAAGGCLGERQRRGRTTSGKREPGCGMAADAISIMTYRS